MFSKNPRVLVFSILMKYEAEIYLGLWLTHCVKSVRIRSFSGPYFPTFGLNTEKYGVSIRTQSKCGKIRTRKTPNTDTFHAVTAFS